MIYLDNAATTWPKPAQVIDRMASFLRETGANPGRGSYRMVQEADATIAAVRRRLASFVGASDPSRVIFTLNTTDALNMAIHGALARGDHVVTSTTEHNSIARPLNRLEAEGVVTVTRVSPGREGILDSASIAAAFTPRTRLVATLHGSNVTGALQPIEAIGRIARDRGALFLLDAAQTAGVWPIDMKAACIDLLAIPGHKSLLGPMGTGALVVGEGVGLRPWREGGTGGDSAAPLQPEEYPHHMEAGTMNGVGIAGLGEGLAWIEARGLAAIRAHEMALLDRLASRLRAIPRVVLYGPGVKSPRVSVLLFNLEGREPDEMAAILDASFGIAVRSGLHCAPGAHREIGTFPSGAIRVSPGPFSTAEEIDALAGAIEAIAP